MMAEFRWIIASLLLSLPHQVSAQQLAASRVKLTRVGLEYDNVILWSDTLQNPAGCATSAAVMVPSSLDRDRYLALATTALAGDLFIDVWIDGCAQGPWGTIGRVYHLSLTR